MVAPNVLYHHQSLCENYFRKSPKKLIKFDDLPGCSILMISAPKSPKTIVQYGPARILLKSKILIPSNGLTEVDKLRIKYLSFILFLPRKMRWIKADITELRKFCFDFCTERFRVQCDQLLSGPIKTKFSAIIKKKTRFIRNLQYFLMALSVLPKVQKLNSLLRTSSKIPVRHFSDFLFFCYETLDCFDTLFSLVLIQF